MWMKVNSFFTSFSSFSSTKNMYFAQRLNANRQKKTTFGKTKKNSKPTPPQTFEKKHFNPETTWSTLKPQLARPYNTQTKTPIPCSAS